MSDKLTIKDLNCQNCTIEECDLHPKHKPADRHRLVLRQWYATSTDAIKGAGCASHPLALQVLVAPVIEELEGWAHINAQSCLDTKGDSLFAVEIGALKLKLAELTKEDVKK